MCYIKAIEFAYKCSLVTICSHNKSFTHCDSIFYRNLKIEGTAKVCHIVTNTLTAARLRGNPINHNRLIICHLIDHFVAERSSTYTYNDDVFSQASRRTANNLLYGDERASMRSYKDEGESSRSYGGGGLKKYKDEVGSSRAYGCGGHIHMRYNPTRSFADDIYR